MISNFRIHSYLKHEHRGTNYKQQQNIRTIFSLAYNYVFITMARVAVLSFLLAMFINVFFYKVR